MLSMVLGGGRLRGLRPAVLALGVGCALVACPQALAVGGETEVLVVCEPSKVVVAETTTCRATVKNNPAGSPAPMGKVAFTSDSDSGFSPNCPLEEMAEKEQSTCSVV
ncbi:MAG: hypothetical protein QOG40_1442, partial [Solirubrobacteraceae bacterium]|nr:hypothetical protein [Solirubrobacteraceae bacterium]